MISGSSDFNLDFNSSSEDDVKEAFEAMQRAIAGEAKVEIPKSRAKQEEPVGDNADDLDEARKSLSDAFKEFYEKKKSGKESGKTGVDFSEAFVQGTSSEIPDISIADMLESSLKPKISDLLDDKSDSVISVDDVKGRTNGVCAHCGLAFDISTCSLHRLLPRRLLGEDNASNLVIMCNDCLKVYNDNLYLDLKTEFPHLKHNERIKSIKYMERRLNRAVGE